MQKMMICTNPLPTKLKIGLPCCNRGHDCKTSSHSQGHEAEGMSSEANGQHVSGNLVWYIVEPPIFASTQISSLLAIEEDGLTISCNI